METRIDETKKRLAVSDEQDARFTAVTDQHAEERTAIIEKYGLDKENATLSWRQLRAFRKDMRMLHEETRDSYAEILTDEQLAEWDAIQVEYLEEMRANLNGD